MSNQPSLSDQRKIRVRIDTLKIIRLIFHVYNIWVLRKKAHCNIHLSSLFMRLSIDTESESIHDFGKNSEQ